MKANELMIGDWICDRDNRPIKVHASPESYYQDIANLTYPYIEDSKPIPLTLEILENNGFVPFIAGQYILPKGDNDWLVNIVPDMTGLPNSNSTMLVAIKNAYTDAKIAISYVHELQHALRLCEIPREIIL